MNPHKKTVLVTGGAGYVGSALVPRLLQEGYFVKVVDLYLFGEHVLDDIKNHPNLLQIKGDIRNQNLLRDVLIGCDSVIHLACISNDPCFELNPELSKSINFDAFEPLVSISKETGVSRFIYASTSSVYGVSDKENVDEEDPLLPITDYNKYKGLCEPILKDYQSEKFTTVTIRPATVCGYSSRQRLDLTVNILTNHALNKGEITVFGGEQMRPNIHIEDMVDLYLLLLTLPSEKIAGKIFNAGYQNRTVSDIAQIVKETVAKKRPELKDIEIVTEPSSDVRSYHICSKKIQEELDFTPKRSIENAVEDLLDAFAADKLPDSFDNSNYFNIKAMQAMQLR